MARGASSAKQIFKLATEDIQKIDPMDASLFELVVKSLTPKLKQYYVQLQNGEVDYDPVVMQNIMMRFVSFYTMEAISWAWANKSIPMELSKLAGEVRQGNHVLEDMKRKRTQDEEKKNDDESGMVGTASESLQARFDALVGEYTVQSER